MKRKLQYRWTAVCRESGTYRADRGKVGDNLKDLPIDNFRNDLAAGFYPTPLTEGNHLIQLLQMESERAYACFDPCCGEGTILRSFADAVKQVGIQLDTYGVELDANRYNKAKSN